MTKEIKIDSLKPHPLSTMIYGDVIAEGLEGSIEADGLHHPIDILKGTNLIIGGISRWKKMKHLGHKTIPYVERDIPEEQVGRWIVRDNVQRKKTSAIYAKEEEILEPELPSQMGGDPTTVAGSVENIGKALGVGHTTVSRIRQIRRDDPKIFEMVKSGEIESIKRAALASKSSEPVKKSLIEKKISIEKAKEIDALYETDEEKEKAIELVKQDEERSNKKQEMMRESSEPVKEALKENTITVEEAEDIERSYTTESEKQQAVDEIESIKIMKGHAASGRTIPVTTVVDTEKEEAKNWAKAYTNCRKWHKWERVKDFSKGAREGFKKMLESQKEYYEEELKKV